MSPAGGFDEACARIHAEMTALFDERDAWPPKTDDERISRFRRQLEDDDISERWLAERVATHQATAWLIKVFLVGRERQSLRTCRAALAGLRVLLEKEEGAA